MSEVWPKSHEIFPFYQFQEMDLSLLSDFYLFTHPFSTLPSHSPLLPVCYVFTSPVLMLLEDTICPKASAIPTQASNHSHHQCQQRAAGGIWNAGIFPGGEPCTEAHVLWQLSATSFSQTAVDLMRVIQDKLCCLFGLSHFLRLYGVILAMIPLSVLHSREWM